MLLRYTKRLSIAVAAILMVAGLAGAIPDPVRADNGAESRSLASEESAESPKGLALEGAQKLMRALESFLSMIPQYGMPQIQENGDILIPRLNPPEDGPDDPSTEPDDGMDETEI